MSSLPESDFLPILKRLNAAVGYLNLGMPMNAWEELESVPAEHRARPEVLKIRVDVCRALEKWEMVAEVTRHLAQLEPKDPRHLVNLAAAIRKTQGEQVAADILEEGKGRFPDNAVVAYNLACYKAVLGDVDEAKTLLAQSVRLDSSLRSHSLDDPDLQPLWNSI